MPVKNRCAELQKEIAEWRHDIHQHPEILFETHRTSALVRDKLKEFGCDEVIEGIRRMLRMHPCNGVITLIGAHSPFNLLGEPGALVSWPKRKEHHIVFIYIY